VHRGAQQAATEPALSLATGSTGEPREQFAALLLDSAMDDSSSINVRACGNGRVHLQVEFVTLCLEAEQLAELVRKGSELLRWHAPDGSPSGVAH
jgi:hypothetical protein